LKFLLEHQVGFDTAMLGFPSIQGCHAIVFQTSAGIYGYHSFGGSAADKFQPRAQKFREFIENLGNLTPATRLYGCSFVGNNQRGYAGVPAATWRQELVAYASAFNYTGKISGYDLSKTLAGASDSAYVEYRINGTKCDVHIRKWDQFGGDAHPPTVANPSPAEHQKLAIKGGVILIEQVANVIDPANGVDRGHLTKVSKQKLR
jgi:hypothetical protein